MLVDVTKSQQRNLHISPMILKVSHRQRLSIKGKNFSKYCNANKTHGRLHVHLTMKLE